MIELICSVSWQSIIIVYYLSLYVGIVAGPHEVKLINKLLSDYNSYERPAEVDNAPLKVEFQVTLRSIIDVVRQHFFCTE